MPFSLDTRNIPRLHSYTHAKLYWEGVQPWRNQTGQYDQRPLDKKARSKRHVSIRKLNDGSIACRLHRLDVVIFHPDDAITINSFPSKSTDAFANQLLPQRVSVSLNSDHGPYIILGSCDTKRWGTSRFVNTITLKPKDQESWDQRDRGWIIINPERLVPICQYRINRAKMRAAEEKYNYTNFRLWFNAYAAMQARPLPHSNYSAYDRHPDVEQWLRHSEDWEKLVEKYGRMTLPIVRTTMMMYGKAIECEEHLMVGSSELTKYTRSEDKYESMYQYMLRLI